MRRDRDEGQYTIANIIGVCSETTNSMFFLHSVLRRNKTVGCLNHDIGQFTTTIYNTNCLYLNKHITRTTNRVWRAKKHYSSILSVCKVYIKLSTTLAFLFVENLCYMLQETHICLDKTIVFNKSI